MSELKPLPPLIRWFPQESDDVYMRYEKAVAWLAILGVALYASYALGRNMIKGEAIGALRGSNYYVGQARQAMKAGAPANEVDALLGKAAAQMENGAQSILQNGQTVF